MTAADRAEAAPAKGRSRRLPLILGIAGALVLGAGGFYAAQSGLISSAKAPIASSPGGPDVAFVRVDPVVVALSGDGARHLRFGATLEVERRHEAEVTRLMPRVLDLLNGYLGALEPVELAGPGALVRLRAQMLRRVQVVLGDGRVRDLLVTEFVLN